MHSVASVTRVSSSRRSQAMHRLTNPVAAAGSVQSVKTSGKISSLTNSSSAQNIPTTTSNLPLGYLLSVSRPPSNIGTANTDYNDMQNDLHTGNLAAAQQAYLRLQSDLLNAEQASSGGSALNITA